MFTKLVVFLALVGIATSVICNIYIGTKEGYESRNNASCEADWCISASTDRIVFAACPFGPDTCDIATARTRREYGDDARIVCCNTDRCNSGESLSSLLPLTLLFLSAVVYSMQ